MIPPRVALFSLTCFALSTAAGQSPAQVTVCELLQDPSGWNGKFVQISADIDFDGLPERGPSLFGRKCSTSILVKGLSFPNLIGIADPQSVVQRVHVVEFEWDEGARGQFQSLLQTVNPKTEHIRATVVGLFETRTPFGDLVRINAVHPGGLRVGFGPGGALPAQVLVKTMTGMRIERNQNSR